MTEPLFDETGRPLKSDPTGGEFAQPGYYVEPPKKQRGCFFYGCLFASIGAGLMFLVVVAIIATGVYFGNQLLNEYTSTTPAQIPVVNLSDDQKKAVKDRWEAFRKAIDEGKAAEIVLTAEDINALIEEEPQLKGKVYIKLKDDKATGEISMPFDVPLKGRRFFNGTATITAVLADGDLDVRLQELEVNGKKLPPEMKAQFGSENVAKDFNRNPENAKMIRQFESVKIADSKVFIKAKARDASAAADKEEPKAKSADEASKEPAPEPAKKAEPPAKPDAPSPAPAEPKKSVLYLRSSPTEHRLAG
ncbi:MAG: hypothetical protein U0835_26395 [Isosphaeraceae bacterium]